MAVQLVLLRDGNWSSQFYVTFLWKACQNKTQYEFAKWLHEVSWTSLDKNCILEALKKKNKNKTCVTNDRTL